MLGPNFGIETFAYVRCLPARTFQESPGLDSPTRFRPRIGRISQPNVIWFPAAVFLTVITRIKELNLGRKSCTNQSRTTSHNQYVPATTIHLIVLRIRIKIDILLITHDDNSTLLLHVISLFSTQVLEKGNKKLAHAGPSRQPNICMRCDAAGTRNSKRPPIRTQVYKTGKNQR